MVMNILIMIMMRVIMRNRMVMMRTIKYITPAGRKTSQTLRTLGCDCVVMNILIVIIMIMIMMRVIMRKRMMKMIKYITPAGR